MSRIISLGQIELTKLRSYRWEISSIHESGALHCQVMAKYVVTDDNYSVVPEGQKSVVLELSDSQQKSLDSIFFRALKSTAQKEQVDSELGVL